MILIVRQLLNRFPY